MSQSAYTPDSLLRKFATPATGWLSLVIGVTGIMMFYHLNIGPTRSIHEWLGWGFVVAGLAHGWRHRQPVLFWMKQKRTYGLAVLCLAVMGGFALMPPSPSPVGKLLHRVESTPLAQLAPVLGLDEQALIRGLQGQGFAAAQPGDSLGSLAKQSGKPFMHVLGQTMALAASHSGPHTSAELGH